MKKVILLLVFYSIGNVSFAQNKEEAEKLVDEGITYHDKGDYDSALAKYDKALEIDRNNLYALSEKAITFVYLQKFEEAIEFCEKALHTHRGDEGLRTVYVTYGNSLDALKKSSKAIKIYEDGIKQFPDYYQLYFNKEITFVNIKKEEDAITSFQQALLINPLHGSSHNAIARLQHINNKKMPVLLAYCRFLAVEPEGKRAKENLANVQNLLKGNAQRTGKKAITININSDLFNDSKSKDKVKENDFSKVDFVLTLIEALDYDEKFKDETAVARFVRKFDSLCASLKENKKDNFGFYWEYYAPYFIQMQSKELTKTFAYLVFSTSGDSEVSEWLKTHKDEIETFLDWSNSFIWKVN